MRRIKILTVAIVLALFGVIYAMGQAQDTKTACSADKAGCCASSCCKSGESCCKAGGKHGAAHSTARDKEECCASCECCKGGGNCCGSSCAAEKPGKAHAKGETCDMSKGADCCGSGDGCCSKDKAKTN